MLFRRPDGQPDQTAGQNAVPQPPAGPVTSGNAQDQPQQPSRAQTLYIRPRQHSAGRQGEQVLKLEPKPMYAPAREPQPIPQAPAPPAAPMAPQPTPYTPPTQLPPAPQPMPAPPSVLHPFDEMETPVLPKKVPKFTLAHISFALGILGVFLIIIGTIYLVFQPQTPAYVDTSLSKADQTRQTDLHMIRDALKNLYQNSNQQYPILTVTINGVDDGLSLELIPLYLKTVPTDSDPASPYYYASLTGKSFLLRARLSNGTLYEVTDETP